jgi:protein-disulfide isomerase
MLRNRLQLAILALASLLVIAAANTARAQDLQEVEGDRTKGSPDAPVVIVEYASVACGTCANFHQNAMPTLERYIDSGDVRLVFREMIAGPPQLAIAGFMLANCAPEDRYFDVIDILFDQQQAMFEAMQQGQAQTRFQAIATSAGFTDEAYQACLSDQAGLEAVQARSQAASEAGVAGTPSFFINGQQVGRGPGSDGSLVWVKNGTPLTDQNGEIAYQFDAATMERVIEYYLADAD